MDEPELAVAALELPEGQAKRPVEPQRRQDYASW